MKKFLVKLLATSILISLVGVNLVGDVAYAVNVINASGIQNGILNGTNVVNETAQNGEKVEPVEFVASIGENEQSVLDMNQEQLINMIIKLTGGAYLTNIKVSVNGGNFSISKDFEESINQDETKKQPEVNFDTNELNSCIKRIRGNQIEINEMDVGNIADLKIPISFNKKETVTEEEIVSDYEIKLDAVYVDNTGAEQKIEKTVKSKINWGAKAVEQIQQNLTRFVKYGNKTLATIEVQDGIENNLIPLKNKEIRVTIPKINGQSPAKIIVTGENIQYKDNGNILEINKMFNADDKGEYNWDSQDKYTITYIYNTESNNEIIQMQSRAIVTTLNNVKLENTTGLIEYETANSIGNLVDLKAEGTSEINKGYMYTSSKSENNSINTSYEDNYIIDIGYADVLDKVVVKEESSKVLNDEDIELKDISNNIKINKVSINPNELTDILGENGSIKLKDERGNEIAILDRVISEKELELDSFIVETSKPIKEGIINIKTEKSIIGSSNSSSSEISNFQKLNTILTTSGYVGEEEISSEKTTKSIKMTNPSSKANLSLSTDRLSTVVENKNVVFNIVLNKTDISDMLYTNPIVKLRLPSQIEKININSARILYEEEMSEGNIEINGNEIIIKLLGNQTQYNKINTTEGTLIRLETNLTLDSLVPSNIESVELEYYNEFSGETNRIQKEIQIVAPSEFVTTNAFSLDGQVVNALQNDETLNIERNTTSKVAEVSASLINNLGKEAKGFTIVGRIPSAENTTIGGADLSSNISTALLSPIETVGLEDAVIYYSENPNEKIDGSTWNREIIANAKSFKIEKSTPLADKSILGFKYKVNIPENLQYNCKTSENYGVYYDNEAQEGINRTLVESKIVSISTGVAPQLQIETSAEDSNEGFGIEQNGDVTEGEYVTYNARIKNTGTSDLHNVKVVASIPKELSLINYLEIGDSNFRRVNEYQEDSETASLNNQIDVIKGGDEVTLKFFAKVNQLMSNVIEKTDSNQLIGLDEDGNYIDPNVARTIDVAYSVEADEIGEPLFSNFSAKNNKGDLNLKLSSNIQGSFIEQNQEILYKLKLQNVNFDNKNNVNVSLNLPKGIVFKEIISGGEGSYDNNNNVLNIKVGDLSDLETKEYLIKVENKSNDTDILKTQALATYDGSNKQSKSNVVEFRNEKINDAIEISQSSNVTGSITDLDKIEFYIDIKNKSNNDRTVTINDSISNYLTVKNCSIVIDGEKIYDSSVDYISKAFNLPAGKSAVVTVTANPYPLSQGTEVSIANQPFVTTGNGEELKANELTLKLMGTTSVLSDETVEETIINNEKQEAPTFRIRGQVWYDDNKDGKRDISEGKASSVVLKLFDSQTKQFVKDVMNNDIVVDSNENGEYEFSNIKPGEYVVVAFYDNERYEIGSYKVNGILSSDDSDFVSAKLEDQEIAASDVLRITQDSIYNIDLGLVKKEIFDLGINKKITKVTVVGEETGTKVFEYNNEKAKVELSEEDANNSTVLVEYNIDIINNSDIAGYAKSIVDFLPKGMTFNSELNPDWFLSKNGNLNCTSIANQKINPGESKSVKLVLVKKMLGENTGLVRGRTEINETYSENGLAEINAAASNYLGESNLATTDVIILKQSNVKTIVVIGISLVIITLIGLVGYEAKKRIIDKLYNYDQID